MLRMTPHHCRHCGTLLFDWGELESHASRAHMRVVERMTVRGRRGRAIDLRELYLLSLDTAKERGVCPDPSNDNGAGLESTKRLD